MYDHWENFLAPCGLRKEFQYNSTYYPLEQATISIKKRVD
jgi:hypothetical protein